MRIEKRHDGAQVMRPGAGKQRLLVASFHPAEVVIVCQGPEIISVKRHFDEQLRKSVPCECSGPCYTQRLDRFCAVLYRAGPTLWDERIMLLPAMGWASLQATAVGRGFHPDDVHGFRCILQRVGNSANGRTTCAVQDRVKVVPAGFDLAAGVRNCTGIAVDFFGDLDGELPGGGGIPVDSPNPKPRVPLGTRRQP
jgi:hypothetical protein